MLKLSRKPGEAIIIDGGIVVHVLAVKGKRVRIAVDAPPDLKIVRKEIQNKTSQQ